MFYVLSKLKSLKTDLKIWVKETCLDLQKAIATNKEKLNVVQASLGITGTNYSLEAEEIKLISEYSILRQMETIDMCQKAEEEWTIFGDMCSKFFHNFLKVKKI